MATKRKKPNKRFSKQWRFVVFVTLFAVIGGLFLLYSINAQTATGTVQGFKVVGQGGATNASSAATAPLSQVRIRWVDGGAMPQPQSHTSNPYFFYNAESTFHRFNVENIPSGWRYIGSSLCYNNTECHYGSVSPPGSYGSWAGNSNSVVINMSGYSLTDLWFHFEPIVQVPTLTLRANNQATSMTVNKGAALTLAWATSKADNCNASGSWSGSKNKAGGSENRTADTATTGQRIYTMTCTNSTGGSISSSVRVIVNAPPVQQPNTGGGTGGGSGGSNGGSSGSGGASSGGSGGGSATTRPTAPRTVARTANPAPAPAATAAPDTTPPTAPSVISAAYEDSVMEISWSEGTDNTGIKNYSLERSSDGTNWDVLTGEGTAETNFSDTTVAFNVTYQYRLQAFDFAGNASGYATTSGQAGIFEPNAKPDQEFSATSEDGLISITVPAGALTQDAMCDLRTSSFLPPTLDGYEPVGSTYELLCKTVDGSKVTSFAQPVLLKLDKRHESAKKYKQLQMHGLAQENDWKSLEPGEEADTFVLGDANNIAVLGQIKKTPIWQTLLKILLVLLLLIGGGIVGLRKFYAYKYRNSAQTKARDFYNKEHGY